MSEADYQRGDMDISGQKATYAGVMRFTGFMGLPLTLGLTAMFTALVAHQGLFMAAVAFMAVFFGVRYGFKLIFK